MARWRGNTTARGYGGTHQKLRRDRLAVHRNGNPCAIGGEPLWLPHDQLDLAHDHANGGYLPGLACSYHNRNEGAVRGNRQRSSGPIRSGRPGDVVCPGCGKVYHYSARICEICTHHYHPTYKGQRTCGRTCGLELKRNNRTRQPATWITSRSW